MKKRSVIISLLLVAAIALGIGYAALSTDLVIVGNVQNSPDPIDVVFKSGVIEADTSKTTADVKAASTLTCTEGAQSATLNAWGFSEEGDKITATFIVENRSNYSVTMSAPDFVNTADLPTEQQDIFLGDAIWVDAEGNELSELPTLGTDAGNNTATLVVTITQARPTAENISADFEIKLKATSAQ